MLYAVARVCNVDGVVHAFAALNVRASLLTA